MEWSFSHVLYVIARSASDVAISTPNFEPTLRSESRVWFSLSAEPRGGNESLSLVILNFEFLIFPLTPARFFYQKKHRIAEKNQKSLLRSIVNSKNNHIFVLRRLWTNIQKQFYSTRFIDCFLAALSAVTILAYRPLARADVGVIGANRLNITLLCFPTSPCVADAWAKSLAVAIFAEALTASPNALRRSSNERLRWFTIFDARRVRAAYFG